MDNDIDIHNLDVRKNHYIKKKFFLWARNVFCIITQYKYENLHKTQFFFKYKFLLFFSCNFFYRKKYLEYKNLNNYILYFSLFSLYMF